jgi:hypothetical protein
VRRASPLWFFLFEREAGQVTRRLENSPVPVVDFQVPFA